MLNIAIIPPRVVSVYLGIQSAVLPRETARFIGRPTRVAKHRGQGSLYCVKDVVLMRMGIEVASVGLVSKQVKTWLDAVRENWKAIMKDQPFVAGQVIDQIFVVTLLGSAAELYRLDTKGARVNVVMNVRGFIEEETDRFVKHLRERTRFEGSRWAWRYEEIIERLGV